MARPTTHKDRSRFLPRPWLLAIGIIALLLFVPVFAFRSTPRGSISGRVIYQGKPIVIGTVVLLSADGQLHSTTIDDQARYRFENIPLGKAQFGVISRDPTKVSVRQGKMATTSDRLTADDRGPAVTGDPKKWFAIISTYEDPRASGLEAEIGSATEHDIKIN